MSGFDGAERLAEANGGLMEAEIAMDGEHSVAEHFRVTEILNGVPGVSHPNIYGGLATVRFDADRTNTEALRSVLSAAGLRVAWISVQPAQLSDDPLLPPGFVSRKAV